MPAVQIFWNPQGFDLDTLGTRKFLRSTDGDTPFVEVSIRMLSVDTPELHYPGNTPPSRQDAPLAQLAVWIQEGRAPIQDELAAHLHPRLATGGAGTLQQQQGEGARQEFDRLLDARLRLPNGRKRTLFLRAADKPFDDYGRLLAYVAPNYSAQEREQLSRKERATFNLLMVEAGWAASFPIYPSIPSYPDLVMLCEAARDAHAQQLGAWANPLALTGYEFRACVRLHEITEKLVAGQPVDSAERNSWVKRYCVDMTTREIFYPQQYTRVPPAHRIFVEPQDVNDAVSRMNLVPPAA